MASSSETSDADSLPWMRVLVAVVCVRISVLACGIVSFLTVPAQFSSPFVSDAPLIYWDAVHYLSILQNGYPPPPLQLKIAYFPLYPMLAWPFAQLVGDVPALLFVSNATAIAGIMLTFFWARRWVDERTAFAGALLLASYPPSVFLSSAYTEGPFMLCVAASLWLLTERRHFAAALVAGLSTGLRPTGIALSFIVCVDALLATSALPLGRRLSKLLAIGLLSIAGLCAYQGYLMARYDRVDAYFEAQRAWEPAMRNASPVPDASDVTPSAESAPSALAKRVEPITRRLLSPGAWNRLLLLLIMGLAIRGVFRPGPFPRLFFALPIVIFLLGWVPGWGARVTSIARFETAAIPCFVLFAYLLRDRTQLRWALIGGGALLECGVYAVQVARGAWGG